MANKVPSPTAGMTFPRPKPDTPPSMVKKIGKTTYRVWLSFLCGRRALYLSAQNSLYK